MSNLPEALEIIREERTALNKQRNQLSNQMYEETKVIEAKYEFRLNAFKSNIEHLDDLVRSVGEEIADTELSEDWDEAATRGEINEFYFMSMLKMMKLVDLYSEVDIKIKQTLKNGINIWTIIEKSRGGWKFYLAYSGNELIGTSYRATASHAGDETFPYSFIGQLDTALTRLEENPHNSHKWTVNITFMEWVRKIKKLKSGGFPAIKMDKGALEAINKGLSGDWSDYPGKDLDITEFLPENN